MSSYIFIYIYVGCCCFVWVFCRFVVVVFKNNKKKNLECDKNLNNRSISAYSFVHIV